VAYQMVSYILSSLISSFVLLLLRATQAEGAIFVRLLALIENQQAIKRNQLSRQCSISSSNMKDFPAYCKQYSVWLLRSLRCSLPNVRDPSVHVGGTD